MLIDKYVVRLYMIDLSLNSFRYLDELNFDQLTLDDLVQLELDMKTAIAQTRATKASVDVCKSTVYISLNW